MTSNIQVHQVLEQGEPRELSETEIWSAIDRIRHSPTMRHCTKLMSLLSFVVGATLKGEAGELKETIICTLVFGRQPDYDPKVDTIVRSQAWRLRAKLMKYYSRDGVHDPIIVSLPRGHYVPVFQNRDAMFS